MAKANLSFVILVKVSSMRISAVSKGVGTRSMSDIHPLPATPTAHLFSAAVAVATSPMALLLCALQSLTLSPVHFHPHPPASWAVLGM